MARTLTARQQEALEALDRSSYVRVKVEDGDGNMVDVRNLEGYDLFSGAVVRASVEESISSADIHLWREADPGDGGPLYSLAPLIEQSLFNRNSGGSYDPFLGLVRRVEIDIATLLQGEEPEDGDYVPLWEGYIDEIEWGGLRSRVTLLCRDPIALLNDTIIEDVRTYGGGSPLAPVQEVMQQILDDNMGSGEFELWVEGDPDDGVEEYKLGHVSVLAALKAHADRIGWNLHWRYQESPGEFRLTLYQPVRDRMSLSGFEPDWTFGPDDYYDLPGVRLAIGGVRNAGELVYVDLDGAQQTIQDVRSSQVAEFRRRFLRLDESKARQIRTETQAEAYLGAVMDDLSVPPLLQNMDAAFHWPVDLCDVHEYSSNNVHYDTTQTLAVFGFQHVIQPNRIRTLMDTSGQPSGGYRRWLEKEVVEPDLPAPGTVLHTNGTARSHTGTTTETALETFEIPALRRGHENYAVRCVALFATSGSGGAKDVAISYGGAGAFPGRAVTLSSGTRIQRIEITIQAVDDDTVEISYTYPEIAGSPSASQSPVVVNVPKNIVFWVDLANSGDSAVLQMSEITWMGRVLS